MGETSTYENPLDHIYLDSPITDFHHNAIIDHILQRFDLKPGRRVVEIGAGSGRFTRMLLERGFEVVALEPEPALVKKLRQNLASFPGWHLEQKRAESCFSTTPDADFVCGFHVLHHLTPGILSQLRENLERYARHNKDFAGWLFLEPNPLNLLYPLQILTTPGMRFAEEKGIWSRDLSALLTGDKKAAFLGTIGLIPPRPFTRYLPKTVQSLGTELSPKRSILRLYSVFGETTESMRSRL